MPLTRFLPVTLKMVGFPVKLLAGVTALTAGEGTAGTDGVAGAAGAELPPPPQALRATIKQIAEAR